MSSPLGTEPSLASTADALLLASLYGLRHHIRPHEASKFVQSTENSDNGYGARPGSPSDLESVRNALLAQQHLGTSSPDAARVASFILSLLDPASGLFAERVGEFCCNL